MTEQTGEVHNGQTGSMKEEISRMGAKGWDSSGVYGHSFGPLPHKTRYQDGLKSVDYRETLGMKAKEGYQRLQQKALGPETGGAGTAGFALVPIYVDQRIVDQSRRYTPLVEMLPRVTNQGMTADYNVLTEKGGAYSAKADAPLPERDDTYTRDSKDIKFLYSVGRVLGPMQAAMPSYIAAGFDSTGSGMTGGSPFTDQNAPNAKQLEVLIKARSMKELEENLILNGDSSSNPTEFDGIIKQQNDTNQLDLEGDALTWNHIEEVVQKAFDSGGRPSLAVASSAVVTELRKIMVNSFYYRPEDVTAQNLPYGVPPQLTIPTMVGDVIVMPSMYLSNESGQRKIYFLDTDYIEMRVLQDMTYEDLAKTNDSSKFMLKIYECLIMRAPQFNSFIDNIQ